MNWTEICIHTTHEAVEPVTNILHEAGVNGLAIEDPVDLTKERRSQFGEIYELDPDHYPEEGVYIKAYLPVNRHLQKTVEDINQKIQQLQAHDIDLGKNQIHLTELNEEDWATAWKYYYKPVSASETMTIVPTWETYEPESKNEVIIELDPGMAFGTGSHPTTLLSLQAIERYVQNNDTVIDVGCGSGVLSIAVGLVGAAKVYAFDLDDVAVKSTQINSTLNSLEDTITAQQNDLLNHVNRQADVIIANILAEVIMTFLTDAWTNLKPNGIFIASGIIPAKQQMVNDELKRTGFYIVSVNDMEDWITIVAKKPEKEG